MPLLVAGTSPAGTPALAGPSPGGDRSGKADYLWLQRYNGQLSGADTGTALGVSPDGSVVLVAAESAVSFSHQEDVITLAHRADVAPPCTGSTEGLRRP